MKESMLQINHIHLGDAIKMLKQLPAKSVQCCVTSPPYFALRDYNVKGQIGLEESPMKYINIMVKVFNEVRRVLKTDGTLWLNIGDSYASGAGGGNMKNKKVQSMAGMKNLPGEDNRKDNMSRKRKPLKHASIKPKDLIGIPWMLAFALRSAGWYLRQDIIWNKPNPMPESCKDRCTKAHEYLFLLSKSKKYYYDAFSIRTPYLDKTFSTFGIKTSGNGDQTSLIKSENWAKRIETRKPKVWKTPDGWDTGAGAHGSIHREGRSKGETPKEKKRGHVKEHQGFTQKWDGMTKEEQAQMGANKRSVWTVPTKPFPEAHFAVFPEELIVDCIKAGSREDDIILDPFMGAGTTALVARKLNRKYIGIELNENYIKIAEKRIIKEIGLFI